MRRRGLAVLIERPSDRGEGEVVPRDLVPREQADLEAFRSGGKIRAAQVGAVDELNLADPWDAVDGEQAVDGDVGLRLLPGLALSCLGRRFVKLQISGWQGPESAPRLDGAPAEQDPAVP